MANTVNLVTTFLPLVDEKFTTESRKSLLTNNDFDWTGAHSIKVYKVSTSAMNDYDRPGTNTATNWSRFGPVAGLDATTEEMTLKKDRSFTFAIDKLDTDETAGSASGRWCFGPSASGSGDPGGGHLHLWRDVCRCWHQTRRYCPYR